MSRRRSPRPAIPPRNTSSAWFSTGLGQYEALAADALLASKQAHSAAGRAPAAAVAYYQQATDLMQAGILPAVGSLANVSAARLDAAYQEGKTDGGTGIAWVIVLGVLLAAALIALQFHLAVRFRRLVNPALVAATVLANQYGAALASVIAVNSTAFTAAISDGEDGAAGWELGLPAIGLVLVAALTFAGVRPRLAEYQ